MAFLQNAQGCRKFTTEIGLAPAKARQSAQRLHQRAATQVLAKIALYPPHPHYDLRRNAGALLDLVELLQPGPQVGDQLTVDGAIYVIQSEPVADRERLIWTLDVVPL